MHSFAEIHLLDDHWHPNTLSLQSDSVVILVQELIFIIHFLLAESHWHLSLNESITLSHEDWDNCPHCVAEEHLFDDHWHPYKLVLQSDSTEISLHDLISTI